METEDTLQSDGLEEKAKDTEPPQQQKREAGDLIGSYKNLLKQENLEKEETGSSSVDLLREISENWGMQFEQSSFQDNIFVINQDSKGSGKKKQKQNILGTLSDKEILEWCTDHYLDYIFAFFLTVCILDCQVYEDILKMADELQEIFSERKNEESKDTDIWNYKSKIHETLGLIEYRDIVYVRGIGQEADFLRLPTHNQSGYYIQLLIKEFPSLKLMLSPYLVSKIFDTTKNKRNYLVIGGCTEALANIGKENIVYFNTQILPLFFSKKTTEADYCLAMLLKQMYQMEQNKEFIITCAEQWGRTTNNPHYPLTVLYLCGMIKNQDDFVWGVWDILLNTLLKEIMNGTIFASNSYYKNLLEFFRSGNRDFSYYKGVIHAFYNKFKQMEHNRKRKEVEILGTLFLLLIINDYADCHLSGLSKRKQDMLWVAIMETLDQKTGQELVFLWKQVLKHRRHPKEGWHILELYLDKYESWDEKDLGRLAFFFYWINDSMDNGQAYSFLQKCMSKGRGRLLIAEKIYQRIIKESTYG